MLTTMIYICRIKEYCNNNIGLYKSRQYLGFAKVLRFSSNYWQIVTTGRFLGSLVIQIYIPHLSMQHKETDAVEEQSCCGRTSMTRAAASTGLYIPLQYTDMSYSLIYTSESLLPTTVLQYGRC